MFIDMNNAISNYCCLWYQIHCDQKFVYCTQKTLIAIQYFCHVSRWDMSLNDHQPRTLSGLKKSAKLPLSKRLGCKHQSLLNIELDHVVVDILHLTVRIADILIRNLIAKMAEMDLATFVVGNREASQQIYFSCLFSIYFCVFNVIKVQRYNYYLYQVCDLMCGRQETLMAECSVDIMSGPH